MDLEHVALAAWTCSTIVHRGDNYGQQLAALGKLDALRLHPNPNIRRLAGAVESCARAVDTGGSAA